MIRKTVLATAIIGAGLSTMTGAAFAGDAPDNGGGHNWDNDHGHSRHHHGHDSWGHDRDNDNDNDNSKSSSCTNNVAAANESKAGGFADVLGGAQTIIPVNVCHILDDNSILNGNHVNVL
jgi:hypothetical protein